MQKFIQTIKIIFVFILPLLLSSCFTTKVSKKEVSKIVYVFGDSSVPPRYHRSYIITATKDEISIIVESYGNLLADTSFAFTAKDFKILEDAIIEAGLKNQEETGKEHDCSGGTTKYITVFSGDKEVMNAYAYKCGGQSFGTLSGDIESFSHVIIAYIPNFRALLK